MARAVIKPYIESHPVAVLVWVATWLSLVIAERRTSTRRQREGATNRDRGSHLLFFACMIPAIALLILSRRIAAGATIRPPLVAFIVGEVIFIAGIGLRLWSIQTLGKYFTTTVQISADQPVIDTGPYRALRHPSYTAILLYAFGAGVLWGNWIGVAAMTVFTLVPLIYRIRIEEDALLSTLGDAYRSYASHRKRIIPAIW